MVSDKQLKEFARIRASLAHFCDHPDTPVRHMVSGVGSLVGDVERAFEEEIERLRTALEDCAQLDLTHYEHHQPRRDGREPKEDGGTIWLTPREIATRALRRKS